MSMSMDPTTGYQFYQSPITQAQGNNYNGKSNVNPFTPSAPVSTPTTPVTPRTEFQSTEPQLLTSAELIEGMEYINGLDENTDILTTLQALQEGDEFDTSYLTGSLAKEALTPDAMRGVLNDQSNPYARLNNELICANSAALNVFS